MDNATDCANKAARFAALHRRSGAFVIPNPWDAGTARVLHGLGFEALATTSAGLDEALAHAKTVVDATQLPVTADLENGFGDDPRRRTWDIAAAPLRTRPVDHPGPYMTGATPSSA